MDKRLLQLAYGMTLHHLEKGEALTVEQIAERSGIAPNVILEVLEIQFDAGLVAKKAESPEPTRWAHAWGILR